MYSSSKHYIIFIILFISSFTLFGMENSGQVISFKDNQQDPHYSLSLYHWDSSWGVFRAKTFNHLIDTFIHIKRNPESNNYKQYIATETPSNLVTELKENNFEDINIIELSKWNNNRAITWQNPREYFLEMKKDMHKYINESNISLGLYDTAIFKQLFIYINYIKFSQHDYQQQLLKIDVNTLQYNSSIFNDTNMNSLFVQSLLYVQSYFQQEQKRTTIVALLPTLTIPNTEQMIATEVKETKPTEPTSEDLQQQEKIDPLQRQWQEETLAKLSEDQHIKIGSLMSKGGISFRQAYDIIVSEAEDKKKKDYEQRRKIEEEENAIKHTQTKQIENQKEQEQEKEGIEVIKEAKQEHQKIKIQQQPLNQTTIAPIKQSPSNILDQNKEEDKQPSDILKNKNVLYRFTLACYNFLRQTPRITCNSFAAILRWLHGRLSRKSS